MTWRVAPKLSAYITIAAAGLVGALALRRPEAALIAIPFALVLTRAARRPAPAFDTQLEVSRRRGLEGECIPATVTLVAQTEIDQLELKIEALPGLVVDPATLGLTLAAGEVTQLVLEIRCDRWGAYQLGSFAARAQDRFGAFRYDQLIELPGQPLHVYPRAETLRALIAPTETQPYAGNLVARSTGSGIEFADIRPFQPGDQQRTINWRASARRNSLMVSERHLEQNTDVIVFLDTFAELRGVDDGTLDLAVRAAASLTARYLAHKDRVGLVAFGGVLRWLRPGGGLTQLYRVVEALLRTDVTFSYAWKGAEVIPRQMLPPNSLVIGLSPLLDDRGIQALFDLRARGYDVAVVEISPEPFLTPSSSPAEYVARRLWSLQRDSLRLRYRRAGISVVEWSAGRPFGPVVEEVGRSRRFGRIARVS